MSAGVPRMMCDSGSYEAIEGIFIGAHRRSGLGSDAFDRPPRAARRSYEATDIRWLLVKHWRETTQEISLSSAEEQRRERAKREREKAALGGLWSRRDIIGRFGWIPGAFADHDPRGGRSAFRASSSAAEHLQAGSPRTSRSARSARSSRRTSASGSCAIRTGSTHCSRSAPTSAARRAGCSPRRSSCPATAAATIAAASARGTGPRPLERLKITLAEDGRLVVDKSVKFLFEKGQWGKPGSFVKA